MSLYIPGEPLFIHLWENRRFPKKLKERLAKKRSFIDKANLILSFDPKQEDSFETIYAGHDKKRSIKDYMKKLPRADTEFSEDELDD